MKQKPLTHAARLLCVLTLALTVTTAAFAAEPPEPTQASPCYPTAVSRTEDGGEIRKMYDLGPEDDPAGIPRSDFEQDGFHYTLTDLLKQELPANESRQNTETVSVPSQSKDMGAVLALLPQTKEFITDDGTRIQRWTSTPTSPKTPLTAISISWWRASRSSSGRS